MWDITLNYRAYSFNSISGQFSFLTSSPSLSSTSTTIPSIAGLAQSEDSNELQEGVEWLTWGGYWGDKKLSENDSRQFCAFGQCRFTDGPLGEFSPRFFTTYHKHFLENVLHVQRMSFFH